MAGRGRGVASFTFNIEALGIGRGSMPDARVGPSPLFPVSTEHIAGVAQLDLMLHHVQTSAKTRLVRIKKKKCSDLNSRYFGEFSKLGCEQGTT